VSFVLGDEDSMGGLPVAMEKVVESMKKGEKCQVRARSKYGYGANGEALGIKPNEDILMEVELHSWDALKNTWEMSAQEKMDALVKNREMGNELFRKGKTERASKRYKKALDCVQSDHDLSGEEKDKAKMLKVPCHLNYALCLMKLLKWKDALEQSNKALEIDPNNPKGLFRRAKVLVTFDQWEDALADLNRAKTLDPNNPQIQQEISSVKALIAAHNKKESALFRNMFQRMGKLEEEEEARKKKLTEEEEARRKKEEEKHPQQEHKQEHQQEQQQEHQQEQHTETKPDGDDKKHPESKQDANSHAEVKSD